MGSCFRLNMFLLEKTKRSVAPFGKGVFEFTSACTCTLR